MGQDDTHIGTVDAQGVALAAIQGLYQLEQDKDSQIAVQQKQIDQLKQQNAALEGRVAALEQTAASKGPTALQSGVRPLDWLFLSALVVFGLAFVWRGRAPSGR